MYHFSFAASDSESNAEALADALASIQSNVVQFNDLNDGDCLQNDFVIKSFHEAVDDSSSDLNQDSKPTQSKRQKISKDHQQ